MVELLHIASGLRKESSGSVLRTLWLLFIVYLTLVNKWFTKIKVSRLILVSSLSVSPAPRLVSHAIILSLSRRGLAVAGLRDYGEQSTYFAGLTVWVDDKAGQVTVQLDPNRCKLRSDSQVPKQCSLLPAHSAGHIWRSSLHLTNLICSPLQCHQYTLEVSDMTQ